MRTTESRLIDQRLACERGRISKQAPFCVALAYPSPYRVGMSSLGFQRIYWAIQQADGLCCERAFLPDTHESSDRDPPVTYESKTPLCNFPVVAFSVAYELEIAGVVQVLASSGIAPLRKDRGPSDPFVIAGGPLTFSNPLPLAPFVDAFVMGEADTLVVDVLRVVSDATSKSRALSTLASMPSVFVPDHHADSLPPIARCDDTVLPAWAPIRTPHTELSDMFLIETERGCSRGCAYCVMRRGCGEGMRVVPAERVLSLVPNDASKVGLVGAAVSDHPKIVDIIRAIADRGIGVGLSSLRPDRLNDDFVAALAKAGYKTLTTAMDGASERIRERIDRHARVGHLERAAELARSHKMQRLKLYLMLGLPGEVDEDIDECVAFVSALSRRIPIALGIAPFCAKRNTPLDEQPFAGMDLVKSRLERLRRGLRGRADVRSASARWAWVEYVLAQGGVAEGQAVLDVVHAGADFSAYRQAFKALGWNVESGATTPPRAPRFRPMVEPRP